MNVTLHLSSLAWAFVLVVGLGATGGYWLGIQYGPSAHDARTIEFRLREVFCEQAVRNRLLNTCEAT